MSIKIGINTSQNVELHYEFAGSGKRILAAVIDYIIKLTFLYFIFYSNLLNFLDDLPSGLEILGILIAFGPIIFYTLIFEYLLNGQTVGKISMRLRVIKLDGTPANFEQIFLRWITKSIDDYTIIPGLVALISIGTTRYKQRLGDLAAGTTVICVPKKLSFESTVFSYYYPDREIKYSGVTRLNDSDITIIHSYVSKKKLSKFERDNIYLLATRVEKHIDEKSSSSDAIVFLNDILKDYASSY